MRDPARVATLDGLRGLAAAYVMLHHCLLVSFRGFPAVQGPLWLGWLAYGRLAVVLFLTLSGFSLALSPAGRGWHIGGTVRFLRRRAWRLLPAYWAALALSLAISRWVIPEPHSGRPNLDSVLVYGLMLQDVIRTPSPDLAFWSIAVEAELCLVLPIVVALRHYLGATLTLAAVGLPVAVLGLFDPHLAAPTQSVGLAIPLLPVFVVGVIASGVAREPPHRYQSSSSSSLPSCALPSCAQLFAVRLFVHGCVRSGWGRGVGSGPPGPAPSSSQRRDRHTGTAPVPRSAWTGCAAASMLVGIWLVGVLGPVWIFQHLYWVDLIASVPFGLLLVALARSMPPIAVHLLNGTIGRALGRVSYSLYLVHVPIVVFVSHWISQLDHSAPLHHFMLTVAVAGPLCLITSWVLTVLVEEPAHRHGRCPAPNLEPGRN
jgi:peptidoglycan/LPS O-acetylase OafA/YrhL